MFRRIVLWKAIMWGIVAVGITAIIVVNLMLNR